MSEPTTIWKVQPSFKYDCLCFLNTLTGDPFYLHYYQDEYDKFQPTFPLAVRNALANLKRKVKDEGQQIISASLSLLFSAVPAQSLSQLLDVVEDSRQLQEQFRKTPYYDDQSWQIYESVRPDLHVIFSFLRESEFENYWQQTVLPQLEPQIATLKSTFADYDIVPVIEKHLGSQLAAPLVTVDVLYYTKPHGIKLVGTEFITAGSWPVNIVLGTAIHEMMHPPFELAGNAPLRAAIEGLRQDQFLMERFNNHNPSFGYNTLEGLIDEDCVQALDQLIGEYFGIAREPRQRWQDSDEGLHVFAVALYSLLKEQHYSQTAGSGLFQEHLLNLLQTELQPGQLETIYNRFYTQSQKTNSTGNL